MRRPSRRLRQAALGAVCAAAAGAAAGCGGASASPSATAVPQTVAAVQAAVGTTSQAGSSRADTTMTITLAGRISVLHGSGEFDYRTGMGTVDIQVPTAQGGTADLRELLTAQSLYLTGGTLGVPAGKWARIDVGSLADGDLISSGTTAPTTSFAMLRGALDDVVEVGTATVQGVPVRHFHGEIDLTKAAGDDPQSALSAQLRNLAQPLAPFDAYLDSLGHLRQIDETFVFNVPAGGGATRQVTVLSSSQLYDFGVPVDVQLPPPADIVQASTQLPAATPAASAGTIQPTPRRN